MSDDLTVIEQETHAIEAVPVLTVQQAIERRRMITKFARTAMKEGTDYGVVPGTEKKTLYKPGAEKLCTLFGLSWRLTPVETVLDWTGKDHGGEPFFYFSYKCELRHGALLVGESEGSCNSWEKKYRYRQGERKCPKCGKAAIIKGKKEFGGGWVCLAKRGGCGAKFKDGDKEIESQSTGQVLNADIHDQVNTIQKMAEKRAFVGSTVIAVNASEFFSSDFDDVDFEESPLDDHKPAGQASPPMTRAAGSEALYGPAEQAKPAQPEPAQPVIESPDLIRAKVAAFVGARQGQEANDRQCGLAVSMLEKCFNSDDHGERVEMRHRVQFYLFGVKSSKDLQGHHWLALLDWLKPARDESGKYQPSEGGILEARIIEHAALLSEGQGELFADPLIAEAIRLGGKIIDGG